MAGATNIIEHADVRVERAWAELGREGDEIDFLARYRALDLAIVLMHSLTAGGECTCGRGLECDPKSHGKHPLWSNWQLDEPRWTDMSRELVRSRRRNLALRLGPQSSGERLIAFDVDGGDDLLAPIVRRFGPLPPTLAERSGRGSHLVFKLPPNVRFPKNHTFSPGIEVKSQHGKFTCPPSLHAAGHRRRWVNPIAPVELPRALAEAIQRPPETPRLIRTAMNTAGLESTAYGRRALEAECQTLAQAKKGERNHALNRAAFCVYQLVAGHELLEAEAERALFDAARDAGLKDREIKLTLTSGAKAGRANPRSAPPREQQARRVG